MRVYGTDLEDRCTDDKQLLVAVFLHAALGGHTSKAHPNESSAFARKMKRREERVIEREKLQAAKEIFY